MLASNVKTIFIRNLQANGRSSFNYDEAKHILNKSDIAVRAILRRLKKKGFIASPTSGFYVIIPPEYDSLGCRPPEQFIDALMKYLNIPYYVGLLSAAELYGSAHHRPQSFQVITKVNHRTIHCGKVEIKFIAKKEIEKFPVKTMKSSSGFFNVSTPEVTLFDLIQYCKQAGGLNYATSIIKDLLDKIQPALIKKSAALYMELSLIQRMGFLLDRVLKKKRLAGPLLKIVSKRALSVTPLVPSEPRKRAKIDKKWLVMINEILEVEP